MFQLLPDWLMSPSGLTPHGFCLLWEPWLIWSFVLGDSGTGLSYLAIPLALVKFARRRTDLVFRPVFWLFAAFILLCSTTHWLELLTIWVPAYRVEAVSKLATAVVSIATSVALWKLLPEALALPSPEQMRLTNKALRTSEALLRQLNVSLEAKVEARTAELTANEAQLRDLLTTLDLGTFVTRDFDGTIRFWSEGCTRLYGWTAEEAVGRKSHELLRTVFPVSRTEMEAALMQDGAWTGDLVHRARDGREVIATARGVMRREQNGRPFAVLEALTDMTEIRRVGRERHRADALLRGIISAAPVLIYAKDREGRLLLANEPVTTLIGKPWAEVEGRTDLEVLDDPTQAEAVIANDRKVLRDAQTEELEELIGTEGGQPRVWLSTKTPLRGPAGDVEGLVGVSVEITERKRAEDRLNLMVHELNHRVKNTLATIQSIATQTLRGQDPALRQILVGRLHALAIAHDVLTRERWQWAELEEVVALTLAPYGGQDEGRFRVSGPPVRLQPRAALALSMGLHELTTNAIKYGALSEGDGDGFVDLRWSSEEGRLRFRWSEHGGPAVTPPAQRGFGTRLIERGLAQDLEGTVQIDFNPQGVTCTIDATLAQIVAGAEILELPRVGASALKPLSGGEHASDPKPQPLAGQAPAVAEAQGGD